VEGSREEELEKRIGELEEKLEGLLNSERVFVDQHYRLSDAHEALEAEYRSFLEKLNAYLEKHEDKHVEINDHLFAAFSKVFPDYDKFLSEADKVMASVPRSPEGLAATNLETVSPSADLTHDKWCLCAACKAKVAEEARQKGERILAKTGHERWCRCAECTARLDKELLEEQSRQAKPPTSFFTGELPAGPKVGAPEWNPFGRSPPPRIKRALPYTPETRNPNHATDCVCDYCVRWRGMGPRGN
jgi:hypothetical protein